MRLGDLVALEKQFREDAENAVCYEERKTLEQCVRDVMAAPTISPDSLRPKGRWIDRPSVKGQVYCSECATIEKVTDSNYKSRSCPNCGADMREV